MTQLAASAIAVEFGATSLFTDITFTVAGGERWGIIGRNGTGKTTLFRLLTGEMVPTRGQIARQPGLTVSLLEQHREFAGAITIWSPWFSDCAARTIVRNAACADVPSASSLPLGRTKYVAPDENEQRSNRSVTIRGDV